ncbi:MAG: Serine/threonine protein phosphatase [Rhodospirillaceae bacterium]|nr:MAG: Serine/threonine protein phosphatase [Rhodospirillaceae bacterium]
MSGNSNIFATLRAGGRLWAIGAIHGEARRLAGLHRQIGPRFRAGDKLVYLGNILGCGADVRATVEEILLFRRSLLAKPDVNCGDIVFLRGGQEEMWRKVLQLHLAPSPQGVLQWMLAQGLGSTITAYGGNPEEGLAATAEGAVSVSRWTGSLRAALNASDGHAQLMNTLRHAAYTDDLALLFVAAGVDPGRPLTAQGDNFWWNGGGFARIAEPFAGFRRVVRGFSRTEKGLMVSRHTVSLDTGCGFGGVLTAVAFDLEGRMIDQAEA